MSPTHRRTVPLIAAATLGDPVGEPSSAFRSTRLALSPGGQVLFFHTPFMHGN